MAQVMREAGPAVSFNTGQRQDVSQAAAGNVNPDFVKYADADRGVTGTVTNTKDNSALDGLVNSLANTANTYLKNKLNTEKEEAYLSGQAAAASGKAASDVESNILTKDWGTAGFNDTKTRLSMADIEAQTAVDMKKLREQPPEKMAEYLQTRRQKLMPLQEGMSLEARKAMMGQIAISDQHAIAKQMSEHQKFIIDQQAKAIKTSTSVAFQGMDASRDDASAYGRATDNAMVNVWGNIVNNPNLPEDMKAKMLEEAAVWALEGNHQQLFEKMQTVKDPQGHTMLDNLDFGARSKLVKAYNASRKETAAMRNSDFSAKLGLYESRLGDDMAEPVPWDEHSALVAQGVQLGVISQNEIGSLAKKWQDGQAKKAELGGVADAYAGGNIDRLAALGKDGTAGAKGYTLLAARKGVPVAQIATNQILIAMKTGQKEGFTEAGNLLRSSISLIGTNETIDPGQLAGIDATFKMIEDYDVNGNRGGKQAFLQAFDEDTRTRLLAYRDGRNAGKTHSTAASEAADLITKNNALSPQERAALGSVQAKDNVDLIAKIEPKGLFAQVWEKMPFRFADNKAMDKISPARGGVYGWRDNEELMSRITDTGKTELLYEMNEVSRKSPFLKAEDRQTKALTGLADRTVVTEGGPVFLPRGKTVQTFFGVSASVSPDVVGAALNTFHTPAKGNRTVYKTNGDGRMQWEEYNNTTGALVNPGEVFDPKAVSAVIQQEQDKRSTKFAESDGSGKVAKGPDGASVRYNGDNTIGISTRVMLRFRDDLVQHEGVRNKPYADGSGGRTSVGVGVNSGNQKHYPKLEADGTVSEENISRSFMTASDAAMKVAHEYFQDLPQDRQNVSATRLLGSMSYQGGSIGEGKDVNGKAFRDAINDPKGTQADALEKLKATRQYKMSPDPRKRFYEDMLSRMVPRNNF